jgi:hypothetical protein
MTEHERLFHLRQFGHRAGRDGPAMESWPL